MLKLSWMEDKQNGFFGIKVLCSDQRIWLIDREEKTIATWANVDWTTLREWGNLGWRERDEQERNRPEILSLIIYSSSWYFDPCLFSWWIAARARSARWCNRTYLFTSESKQSDWDPPSCIGNSLLSVLLSVRTLYLHLYMYMSMSIGYLIGEKVDIFHRRKFDQFVVTFSRVNRSTSNTRCICIVCFSARTDLKRDIIKTSVSISYLTILVELLISCGPGRRRVEPSETENARNDGSVLSHSALIKQALFLHISSLCRSGRFSRSTSIFSSIDSRRELLDPSILIIASDRFQHDFLLIDQWHTCLACSLTSVTEENVVHWTIRVSLEKISLLTTDRWKEQEDDESFNQHVCSIDDGKYWMSFCLMLTARSFCLSSTLVICLCRLWMVMNVYNSLLTAHGQTNKIDAWFHSSLWTNKNNNTRENIHRWQEFHFSTIADVDRVDSSNTCHRSTRPLRSWEVFAVNWIVSSPSSFQLFS